MTNSDPVYSFRDTPRPPSPDLSGINEILGRYTHLNLATGDDSSDVQLLTLRREILGVMGKTPECSSDVRDLLSEVNELLADQIYAADDREAISQACLDHWKATLVPHFTQLCVDTVKAKLRGELGVGELIDIGFALEQGVSNRKAWEDLLLDDVGPVVTTSSLSADRMRCALSVIRFEYEIALRVARL
jgi:hypothetical protein